MWYGDLVTVGGTGSTGRLAWWGARGESVGRNRIARSGQDSIGESQRIGRQAQVTRATPRAVVAAIHFPARVPDQTPKITLNNTLPI